MGAPKSISIRKYQSIEGFSYRHERRHGERPGPSRPGGGRSSTPAGTRSPSAPTTPSSSSGPRSLWPAWACCPSASGCSRSKAGAPGGALFVLATWSFTPSTSSRWAARTPAGDLSLVYPVARGLGVALVSCPGLALSRRARVRPGRPRRGAGRGRHRQPCTRGSLAKHRKRPWGTRLSERGRDARARMGGPDRAHDRRLLGGRQGGGRPSAPSGLHQPDGQSVSA